MADYIGRHPKCGGRHPKCGGLHPKCGGLHPQCGGLYPQWSELHLQCGMLPDEQKSIARIFSVSSHSEKVLQLSII